MKVYYHTLGCKVNQYQTAAIEGILAENGFTAVQEPQQADVIVVNSCTVTSQSDMKTRREVRHLKALRPGCCLVLTGCMVQADPACAAKLPQADIIAGVNDAKLIPGMIKDFFAGNSEKQIAKITPHDRSEKYGNEKVTSFDGRTRAYIKIQDGCDRYCTYCIIPTAKGPSRSRSRDDINDELKRLEQSGYKEIVLVGINLCCYGLDNGQYLPDIINDAASYSGFQRIRLGSLEYDNIDSRFIESIRPIKKLCPQFHLSLQSGSDKILRAMNRHYTSAQYAQLCDTLRQDFPGAAITTDIMAGFPGETYDDHAQTLDLIRKIRFEKVHVFPYSKRAGTPAASMPQVSNAVKLKRAHEISQLSSAIRSGYLESCEGSMYDVLCERKHDGYCLGYTANYTPVKVITDKDLQGLIVPVLINGTEDGMCTGQIYEKEL